MSRSCVRTKQHDKRSMDTRIQVRPTYLQVVVKNAVEDLRAYPWNSSQRISYPTPHFVIGLLLAVHYTINKVARRFEHLEQTLGAEITEDGGVILGCVAHKENACGTPLHLH